jgi:6-phosphogluconolactonase (cycloisomerase 2 family)
MYVSNFDSDDVSVFDIGHAGTLTLLDLVPVPAGGRQPLAGAITPDRRHVYFAGFGSGDVSAFRVLADGSLAPNGLFPPASSAPLTNASGIAVSPHGAHIYAGFFNGGAAGAVAAFSIGDGGLLSPLGAPIPSGGDGTAGVAIAPDGRFLYAANKGSSTVSPFAIRPDGTLQPVAAPHRAGAGAFVLAVAADGAFVYVADADGDTLTTLAVGADGSLSPAGTVAAGAASPRGLLLAPDGRTLYVAHYNTGHNGSLPGSVAVFRLQPSGAPAPLGDVLASGGNGAEALALAPDGGTLYVANFGSSTIARFAVGADGLLTASAPPVATGGEHPDFGAIVINSYGTS